MNFAEAVRRASRDAGQPIVNEPTSFETPSPAPPIGESNPESGAVSMPQISSVSASAAPEGPHPAVAAGNVVRLELFLTAEQTSSMLRAIISGQHTVLTVGEAAQYLRVRPQALARLAEDGLVPGVVVDGKWRFPKNTLDEWLANGGAPTLEDQSHVA